MKPNNTWKDFLEGIIFAFIFLAALITTRLGRENWLDFILLAVLVTLSACVVFFIIKVIAEILFQLLLNLFIKSNKTNKIVSPPDHTFSKVIRFLFSEKTQKDIFKPIFDDWKSEYAETLSEKEFWKAKWVNLRYYYAILSTMWVLSPIGDLIEFIRKFAK